MADRYELTFSFSSLTKDRRALVASRCLFISVWTLTTCSYQSIDQILLSVCVLLTRFFFFFPGVLSSPVFLPTVLAGRPRLRRLEVAVSPVTLLATADLTGVRVGRDELAVGEPVLAFLADGLAMLAIDLLVRMVR
jgi:hypothetical protein